MSSVTTGLSESTFTKLYLVNSSGDPEDILTLINSSGGVSNITSGSSELVVTTNGNTKILTLNLGSYMLSSDITANFLANTSEAAKIGTGNATHLYDFKTQTLTIQSDGNSKQLSLNNGGNVQIGNDEIIDANTLGGMNFINSLLTTSSSPLTLSQNPNNYSE